jgi:hypothetical protein
MFPPLLFYLAEQVLQEINTGLSKRHQLLPSNFTQQQHKRTGTSATGREYKIQGGSSKQLTYSGARTNRWHCSSRRTGGSDGLELGVGWKRSTWIGKRSTWIGIGNLAEIWWHRFIRLDTGSSKWKRGILLIKWNRLDELHEIRDFDHTYGLRFE